MLTKKSVPLSVGNEYTFNDVSLKITADAGHDSGGLYRAGVTSEATRDGRTETVHWHVGDARKIGGTTIRIVSSVANTDGSVRAGAVLAIVEFDDTPAVEASDTK